MADPQQLLAYGSLVLSIVALALLGWTAYRLREVRQVQAGMWVEAHEQLDGLETAREQLRPGAGGLRGRSTQAAMEASAPAPDKPGVTIGSAVTARPALSPYEERVSSVRSSIEHFNRQGELWSAASGVDLNKLTMAPELLSKIAQELETSPLPAEFEPLHARSYQLLPEVVRVVLRKTDLDVDSARSDQRVQASLNEMMRMAGLSFIDPSPGEIVDPSCHESLGIYQEGTAEQRGKVGKVRCRGLRGRHGEVLAAAEVLEYD